MAIDAGELVRLDVPVNPGVVTIARMVVAGVVSAASLPLVERLDDLRLAVTEACNHVVRRGTMRGEPHRVEVSCQLVDNQLAVRVEAAFNPGSHANTNAQTAVEVDVEAEQEWGKELLGALVDDLEFVDDVQRCAVLMMFGFPNR